MIDIWSAVRWWDEWQMRILVLASLCFQWFLLLAAPMRKYTIPKWFRFCIWVAYMSCDALAIYALATLFNRHAKATSSCDYGAKASSLEVLWAPLLLIYLGGREEITAYTIEDNELWTRHTMTLVSQVTVALYSFYKSWPSSSDRKLLFSAVLLFIVGVISFCEKPWSLRRASINRLVAMSSLMQGERKKPSGLDWWFTELDDSYKCWKNKREGTTPILSQGDKVHLILSDLSLYAAERTLESQKREAGQQVLETLNPDRKKLKVSLRQAFGIIYTRANVISTPAYLACHMLLVPSLHIAAIILFATSQKHGYNRTDVKTTYVLLCFTAVLDVFGLLISELLYWLLYKGNVRALCENIPGYNLIDWVLRIVNPKTGWLLKCAKLIGYKEGYFGQEGHNTYGLVSQFVTASLLSVSDKNTDLASYRSLAEDNWILGSSELKVCTPEKAHQLCKSLTESPFDESVIVWHIATDLYFRSKPPKSIREVCTEAISNYMVHLLKFRPEMLMTGSRQHLLTETMQRMEGILKGKISRRGASLVDKIKKKVRRRAEDKKSPYSLINDACKLADELMGIEEDETRLELMYRVWVGMLCYSASMCRGYLHAKSLGEGGEFLSYVWLVISLKGAKTLADKLQMPEPKKNAKTKKPEDGDKKKKDESEAGSSINPEIYETDLLLRQWLST
ncbi:unnamed protein product [Urochloa decumbens]|uniref:DUF4220 domain-containing protein n=1 Tax=Urochloa decumbens TaxID=240449 RepID=A0ABC9C2Q5_9POAL